MKIAVIIPSRRHSTRLPSKPLALIHGKTLLERVIERARLAIGNDPDVCLCVATDDAEIAAVAEKSGVQAILTDPDLASGTDRVFAAVKSMLIRPDVIINLQGDAPFMPVAAIQGLLTLMRENIPPFATVVGQLSWKALEAFQEHKQKSPSSGTTAIVLGHKGHWFSKSILPVQRNAVKVGHWSNVHRHYGLYAYSYQFLEDFTRWSEGEYEKIEGLEQLRAIENAVLPELVILQQDDITTYLSIDTPFDLAEAEHFYAQASTTSEEK